MRPRTKAGSFRPERGQLIAEFVLDVLKAYKKATCDEDTVLAAFEQAGICYRLTDRNNTEARVAYIDPSMARAVKDATGLFADRPAVERPPRWQLRIAPENSGIQWRARPRTTQPPGAAEPEAPRPQRSDTAAQLTHRPPRRPPPPVPLSAFSPAPRL